MFENVTEHQKVDMLSSFKTDKDGNIIIQYQHKGYKVNDKKTIFGSDIVAVSMFSGAGGLDIGAQLAGVKVISSSDIFHDSVETLKLNRCFEHAKHFEEDINSIDVDKYKELIRKTDYKKLIIIGGPPCQPFSKAGYWVTNEKRDSQSDPRNLIKPYFDFIKEIKPDGFVLENVESILHPSNQAAIEQIEEFMRSLGYNYSMLKLDASDYGIPQKRKRIFFLASKKPINAKIKQTHGSPKDIKQNPELLPYERVIDWIGTFSDEGDTDPKLTIEGKWEKELKCIPFGKNYIALSAREHYPKPVFVAGKRYWSSLLKLDPLLPSWTIIASPGHWEGPFHWNNRRMSIREIAAIQTFPDDYVFSGSFNSIHKQIGNAVPPLLGKIVVEELLKWL